MDLWTDTEMITVNYCVGGSSCFDIQVYSGEIRLIPVPWMCVVVATYNT